MNFDQVIAERSTKTIYRDGDRVIKLFGPAHSKADVLNEALNQARVEETGLNIPKVLEVTVYNGRWAIVSEYIEGKTLQHLMDAEPEKMDRYLEQFVDLQLEMQAQRCPLLNKLWDKMDRKIDEADIADYVAYELHTRLAGMKKHHKVCHGDFNPSNVIIRAEDGMPFVLDWSHATQGNGSADAARTYLLYRLKGESDAAEKYLNLYCEKSGTDRGYVQDWLPIVAASQSVKGNREERDFLLKWINVAQYQ